MISYMDFLMFLEEINIQINKPISKSVIIVSILLGILIKNINFAVKMEILFVLCVNKVRFTGLDYEN